MVLSGVVGWVLCGRGSWLLGRGWFVWGWLLPWVVEGLGVMGVGFVSGGFLGLVWGVLAFWGMGVGFGVWSVRVLFFRRWLRKWVEAVVVRVLVFGWGRGWGAGGGAGI
ncbi:hypothetical protein U1Q18_043127 [Sarracenia purpurea var. burkii]